MTRISVEVPYFYSTDSKVGVDCFCMFFYLFGIGVCVLLPVAAYLLLGRRKQPIERQQLQPTVRRNTDGQRRERQLGRAVLEEERVMTSPTRGNTPRHLSFSSAVKMSGTSSLRARNVPSLKQQMMTGSLLSSPRGVTKSFNQTGGGLVDYVTKTRLKKDQELLKSPVMVRLKPTAPPPVKQMSKELNPTNREMVLSALKQKTRRKRAISPDDVHSDDKLVSAAKRKRPPEGVSHGTKRQAGDEDTESVAKRSRNISDAGKDTQRTDKGQKRAASPPTASVHKRPVLHQNRGEQTRTRSSTRNRLVLDDDSIMHDVSTTSSKASQKRLRNTEKKAAASKSSVAKVDETRVESKEKKQRRRKSADEKEPAVQVFESTIPVYSPGLREGVALRRAVPLRSDPKAPLHLPSQLTKGKTYSKEDIEHDRQAAHSRVEYLLAEDEEEEKEKENERDKEVSSDQTAAKDGNGLPRDEPDGEVGTKDNESVTDSTVTDSVKPPVQPDSDSKDNEVVIEEHKVDFPRSIPTGFKLGGNTGLKLKGVAFKLPAPPKYNESQGNPLSQQPEKEQVPSQSIPKASLPLPNSQTGLGSLNQPGSTEMPKPVFSLMTPQQLMSQQPKLCSSPLSSKPNQPVTTSSLCQPPPPAYSLSTGNSGQSTSSGFSLSGGISFGSTATPQTEKTAAVVSAEMVSPMSDDDMGAVTDQTGTLSQSTTTAGPSKVSFNLLPSIQTGTAPKVQEAEAPKLSFGLPSVLQKEGGLAPKSQEAAVPKLSFGLPSGQQKEGGLPKVSFSFGSSGQLGTGQKTQGTSGGQGLSFQFKPSTPGGNTQPTENSGLFGSSNQNQGSSFTMGGVNTAQPTQSDNFRFALKPQAVQDQQKTSSGPTFQFGSPAAGQTTQQGSIPVPSFGSIAGNQATNQSTPSTFNFSLAAATAGQTQIPGLQFGNQQTTPSKAMFNTQSTSGFTTNQSFGNNTPSVGFTLGSSLSARRPVARAKRRTQTKPR